MRTDWKTILPPAECSYVLGNPPFVGKAGDDPRAEGRPQGGMERRTGYGRHGLIDAWYALGAEYLQGNEKLICAFVSTNSICQGEQVGLVWSRLLASGQLKIHFAHRTFKWESEARGKAHVHCVIVGFGAPAAWPAKSKRLYDYVSDDADPMVAEVKLSPIPCGGIRHGRGFARKSICTVPPIIFGSMPNDGGNLLLTTEEKDDLITKEPAAAAFVRPFLGSEEFINGLQTLVPLAKERLAGTVEINATCLGPRRRR
ncbi:MAG: DNA methyltransferase [Kiritimatiellia bacterium]